MSMSDLKLAGQLQPHGCVSNMHIWSDMLSSSIQLPLDKMAAILQTTFSNAFSSMKICILIWISLKSVPKHSIDMSKYWFR